ncbi:hypothetical protein C4K22_3194 [Pseudomonas chlororaphis subsp. aurantiaca]|uniref:Uncharacterized protein n=1 Tax=Pseudomonas chlororaphis subsp. aureofaciens TaxID=587851 RepID=A0AAD0ZJG4_9PSED|nr:hypothetical protein C4K33_3072 [Pseudomonas chlororaphis subsp. piscium]AZD22364.1 hypothetical protein C4K24_3061 [Pseudomonas chlororaphis subsp. aurantiaca]AZD86135.1 hypothetical protein C4K14_3311 [Pseudomonas chlororaphis subsp. aureofaciens]AZC69802.1 hypothetical protein C4K32_3140 [Pseudomonas chlororaphis subsp. piscium]AZC76034.1 hypothetical protein C4K31_3131 [Pseudomonas chlororaphis subsp. piscium]
MLRAAARRAPGRSKPSDPPGSAPERDPVMRAFMCNLLRLVI